MRASNLRIVHASHLKAQAEFQQCIFLFEQDPIERSGLRLPDKSFPYFEIENQCLLMCDLHCKQLNFLFSKKTPSDFNEIFDLRSLCYSIP